MNQVQFNPGYQDKMTDDMLAVIADFNQVTENEIELCDRKIREAEAAANIPLPMKTSNGTAVVHGSRIRIQSVANYWKKRKELLLDLIKD